VDASSHGDVPMLPLVGPHDQAPRSRAESPDQAVATNAAPGFLPGVSSKPLVFDMPLQPAAPRFQLELASQPPPKLAKPPPVPSKRTLRLDPPPPAMEPPAPATPTLPIPVDRTLERSERAATNTIDRTNTFDRTNTLERSERGVTDLIELAITPEQLRQPAPLLIDVTPLSLSVETVGGFCDVLIEANTPVPCDRTRPFATASDGQTDVRVRVAQGPSKRFVENTYLGELELHGIASAPRGETQIAVTFEIDADGILNVRARDMKTGQETAARMQLVGAQGDPADMAAMQARQMAHPLAPL